MGSGKRRDSVFTLAGLKTLLDTSGSRRHSVAVKSSDRGSLTTEQTEAALQLREFLLERQRLTAQQSLGVGPLLSPPGTSGDSHKSPGFTSTDEEDHATTFHEVKSLSDDDDDDEQPPPEMAASLSMLPRSFVPQPTSRRASVAVMHMTDQKLISYDLPTPSTVCAEEATHRTPSWSPISLHGAGSSSLSGMLALRCDSQTQTQADPSENRGCQTSESALQWCERGVQACLDEAEDWSESKKFS